MIIVINKCILWIFLLLAIYPPNTDKSKPYSESYNAEEFDYLSKLVIGIENSAQPKSDELRSVVFRLGKLNDIYIFLFYL